MCVHMWTTRCLHYALSRKYIIPPRMFQSQWHSFALNGSVIYYALDYSIDIICWAAIATNLEKKNMLEQRTTQTSSAVTIFLPCMTCNITWFFTALLLTPNMHPSCVWLTSVYSLTVLLIISPKLQSLWDQLLGVLIFSYRPYIHFLQTGQLCCNVLRQPICLITTFKWNLAGRTVSGPDIVTVKMNLHSFHMWPGLITYWLLNPTVHTLHLLCFVWIELMLLCIIPSIIYVGLQMLPTFGTKDHKLLVLQLRPQ